MFEFLLGYWIGKDSQKDPKGTMIALMIVPPGLLLAFWAYFAFIDFSKSVWAMYLTYSTCTTVNLDFIILAVLALLNFFVNRLSDTKEIRTQMVLLFEKLISAIVLPWVIFDIAYKSEFIEQIQAQSAQLFGASPAVTHSLLMPDFMSGLSFYTLTTGAIGLATLAAPFVVIGLIVYLFYTSKTASAETPS